MELQTRHQPRRIPTWRKIALNGLGAADTSRVSCADLTPWQQSQDPRCGGGSAGPAVYQAPTLIPVPACISGPEPYSAECQAQLMATQHQNQSAADSANRAVFVADCNRDWTANAARFKELGLAIPPNDCDYRGYGLTPVGSTGSSSAYVPGTPQAIIDWRNANPGGGSPGPAAGGSGGAGGGLSPSFAFTNLTSGDNTNFRVGDRWQIDITGPANAPVSMNGGRNGENNLNQMGSTDSSGRFKLNGQMGQGEIGNWAEAWRVNNQIVASFSFRVLPASTASGATTFTGNQAGGGQSTQTQSPISKSVFGTLPGGSISIGGNDIPVLALGAAALIAFFMFKGGQ